MSDVIVFKEKVGFKGKRKENPIVLEIKFSISEVFCHFHGR
jgi:hypothetical protein